MVAFYNGLWVKLLQLSMLLALIVVFLFSWEEMVYYNNPVKRITAQNDGVAVLYMTEDCVYCAQIKSIFSDESFPYVEYDIDKNSKARNDLFELGGKGVPLLLVDGELIPGFNMDKIVSIVRGVTKNN